MKRQWLGRRIAAPGPFLALCLNQQQLVSAFADLKRGHPKFFEPSETARGTTYIVHAEAGLACVVCVKDVAQFSPIEIAGLLVHEAVHVFQAYCQNIGEETPGEEQQAYGIQSIAQELMAEFARQMRENNSHPTI